MTFPGSRTWVVVMAVLVIGGCASSSRQTSSAGDGELGELIRLMTGRFSSQAQAQADADYRDIRLELVRIWPERTDGVWLYIEQAVAGKENQPYRQRVYHLTREADLYASAVFSLPDPAAVVGAGRKPDALAGLSPEKLLPRTGCTVYLRKQGPGRFEGRTAGKDCPSELRGAVYATSEVVIESTGMASWDRGYDEQGKQVWGAEKGPYRFLRERMK